MTLNYGRSRNPAASASARETSRSPPDPPSGRRPIKCRKVIPLPPV